MKKGVCVCIAILVLAPVSSWAEPWRYPAVVERVVDGDTLDLVITLGFGFTLRDRCRLLGVDAAELKTSLGREAKTWVQARYKGEFVVLTTERRTAIDNRGKYGRILGTIYLPGEEESLNDALVRLGYAERVE